MIPWLILSRWVGGWVGGWFVCCCLNQFTCQPGEGGVKGGGGYLFVDVNESFQDLAEEAPAFRKGLVELATVDESSECLF